MTSTMLIKPTTQSDAFYLPDCVLLAETTLQSFDARSPINVEIVNLYKMHI